MSSNSPFYVRGAVKTNSFAISELPKGGYRQYDDFKPPRPASGKEPKAVPAYKRKKIMHHLQIQVASSFFNPRMIFDGKSIAFAPERLVIPPAGQRFFVNLDSKTPVAEGSPGSYTVIITPTVATPINAMYSQDLTRGGRVTTQATTAINLVQIIVRQGPDQSNARNARAFFFDNGKTELSGGIEMWRGVVQSVRPAVDRLVLTIDTAAAAVYRSGSLADLLLKYLGFRDGRHLAMGENDPNLKRAEKFVKKLLITVQCGQGQKRTKTIHGLIARGGRYAFEKDGVETTVEQHFRAAYNIRTNPDLPGVRITSKSSKFQSIIPIELCRVEPGQMYRQKLGPDQLSQMIKLTAMPPEKRGSEIMRAAENFHHSMYVKEAKMAIERAPMQVNAKLLAPAHLTFGGSGPAPMRVDRGSWNVLGKHFNVPKSLQQWAVLNFCGGSLRSSELDGIVRGLMDCCHTLGMATSGPLEVCNANPQAGPWQELENLKARICRRLPHKNSDKPNLNDVIVVAILPNEAGPIRNTIKYWGDCRVGILTQCLRLDKCRGAKSQYLNNVALKINARLGGVNFHSISNDRLVGGIASAPLMIMGADVGHPGPGIAKPSVTSLVYSHDQNFAQYGALTRVQSPRAEIIEDLEDLVYEALMWFGRTNGTLPWRIIFFRDGVSEGEFSKVKEAEVIAVRRGCQRAIAKSPVKNITEIKLTFIVVGKRHHSLFFPGQNGQGDQKGNLHPGAVIDSGITHPTEQNFYLQSHAAIQGTSRSGHYTVLEDENFGGDMDRLQRLSYLLCHVYAKATRSVSIPAPVYYADLVCARGMFHFDPQRLRELESDDLVSVSSGASGAAQFDINQWKAAFRPIHENLARVMYFL